MATVQRYTPVSQAQQLPGVMASSSASPTAYGAGTAQALGGIGESLQYAGKELNDQQVQQQHEDNLSAVQTALASSAKEISDLHYNADTGLLHTQGINSKGITATSKKLSDEIIEKKSKMFTNDVQKNSFMKAIEPQLQSFQNTTMNHESQQTKVAAIQSSDSVAANNLDIASTAYNNFEVADNAIRMGIKSQTTKGMILGLPNETINENIKKYSDGVLAGMVKTALDQNDINGARGAVIRYGDKVDQKSINIFNESINKKALPIKSKQITDSLVGKYGLNEQPAMAELEKAFGKDPNFKSYSADLQAKFVDLRRYDNENKKKTEEATLTQMWSANTLEESKKIINNSNVTMAQKITLLERATAKFKALEKPTPDQTFWHNFERESLKGHLENIALYEKKIKDVGEITDEQQKSFNKSSAMLTDYWVFTSGGGFNPNAKPKEVLTMDEYKHLKYDKHWSDADIQEKYLTEGSE
jgi:hypothetical protein